MASAGATSICSPTTPARRPRWLASARSPSCSGHETAGRVVEAGPECSVEPGTRVVIDPCIPCLPRGIDPLCANCARGWTSSCLNLDSRIVSSGRSLGFTSRTSAAGGPTAVVAHDVDAAPAARHRPRPRRQPLRAGVDRLPRPAAGGADRRRPGAHRGRRHHRPGRAGGATWAVPRLRGDGAGAARAPGGGRYRVRGRPRRAAATPPTATGRTWRPCPAHG